MPASLQDYGQVAGTDVIRQLHLVAANLKGAHIVHVNSTRTGGGVAEILSWMVPLMTDLGLKASWEVITGDEPFFQVTKSFHNALQGNMVPISNAGYQAYRRVNEENAERLRPQLEAADFVIIHDPQPAYLLNLCPNRRGKWVWRCHIDASHPYRPVWKFLRNVVQAYDASIFSMARFAQPLRHPQFVVAPSIDPLAEKNIDLPAKEIAGVQRRFQLDPERPLLLQVSRFDRFKDPVGVIKAYQIVRRYSPVQLVLAGGTATDDPEGQQVLDEVREAAGDDPDIHILSLPSDAHRTINALQRASDVILQKSIKEGFGLTVTEGLWKAKPVIGGDVGGIRLQVVNHHTGFLVSTPEGAAFRIRYLLEHREKSEQMGQTGREFVRQNFLLTRHIREYLTIMLGLRNGLKNHLFAGNGGV